MKRILTFLSLLLSHSLFAQPTLKPSIGIGALPNNADSICAFPVATGNYNTAGFAIGDTVPDFTLYTPAGTAVNLQTVLGQGKPVLLVGGNLTCPVFRGKIATLNNMSSIYAGQLEIYIIYGMEAHPTTPSPYSGAVWITNSNQQAGILHPQPTTYGERKALIDTLLALGPISPPILVDGPCNEFLSSYGPAPNNAYLIDTTGIIYEKQGWFHKLPDDMYCEIDSLLGTNSGQCNANGNNGSFTFSYVADTIDFGAPNSTLAVHATLTNVSSTDNVIVDIIRWNVDVPAPWLTAMCVDVCLPTTTNTTQVTIPPSMTQDFTFYFYTGAVDTFGYATIGFRNNVNNANKYFRNFWGETSKSTALIQATEEKNFFQLYPNPSTGTVHLSLSEAIEGVIEIFDWNGRRLKAFSSQIWEDGQSLDLKELPTGLYLLQLSNSEKRISKKLSIK